MLPELLRWLLPDLAGAAEELLPRLLPELCTDGVDEELLLLLLLPTEEGVLEELLRLGLLLTLPELLLELLRLGLVLCTAGAAFLVF